MENESAPRRGYPWWGWMIAALTLWPLVPMVVGVAIPSTRKYLGAPGVIITSIVLGIGCVVVVVVASPDAGTGGQVPVAPAVATVAPTPNLSKDEACLRDDDCIRDRTNWLSRAGFFCSPQIEDEALYSHEWTDGWIEPKFSRFVARPDRNAVHYFGDKLKFQNGFGAWQRMFYSCLYDPINERVLDVSVAPFN